jgi:nitrous oxidase accessory protein
MRRCIPGGLATVLVALALAGTVGAVGLLATGTDEASAAAEGATARLHRLAAGAPLPSLVAGDELVLAPGRHVGPWRIDVPDVTLRTEPGARLDGGGRGSALTLAAPGITVVGLEVRGVGPEGDLYAPDAAFRLDGCHGCRLVDVRAGAFAEGVSAALWVEASADVRVVGLRAIGNGAGPGVTSFEAPGLTLEDVRLTGFLDGLYLERSDGLLVRAAELIDSGRYGVHLMFNRSARLEDVRAAGGGVGSAVMYGRDTVLRDVVFEGHTGPMAFGLLVQEERNAIVERATLRNNTIGLLAVAAPGLLLRGADLDANGFGAVLQRLPAAFDGGEPELETALSSRRAASGATRSTWPSTTTEPS